MSKKINDEMSRKIACFGCEDYKCYTTNGTCGKKYCAVKMAEYKDEQFEKVMKTLKTHLDADNSNNDNEGFCNVLRDIFYEQEKDFEDE